MNKDIKLYIKNKKVDLSDKISFPFQYQFEDLNNPSIVKNNFSKTITIEGTKNNNKIFGEIFNLDRNQEWGDNVVGVHFNPLQRTEFALYRNNTCIESGYMQLNSIVKKQDNLQYKITLYGGLGDFFYSLMYDEEGNEKTLANLDFGIANMDFQINKEFVNGAWDALKNGSSGVTIYDLLTFVPAYNGKPDTLDCETVLINTTDSKIYKHYQTSGVTDNGNYLPYKGYMLGELSKEYTEWEMQDLRSYSQRPALKLTKLFEAICNPVNNGGYTVELDNAFFNDTNKYYNDAYITLPLLSELELESDGNEKSLSGETLPNEDDGMGVKNIVGIVKQDYENVLKFTDSEIGIEYVVPPGSISFPYIDMGTASQGASIRLETDCKLILNADFGGVKPSDMYLSYATKRNEAHPYWNVCQVYLSVVDTETLTEVASSTPLTFSNAIKTTRTNVFPSNANIWNDGGSPSTNNQGLEGASDVDGHFYLQDDGTYLFKDTNKNDTFHFVIPEFKNHKKVFIALKATWYTNNRANYKLLPFKLIDSYLVSANQIHGEIKTRIVSSSMQIKFDNETIVTNQLVKKEQWLKTDYSPADVLLDYTKLFGLTFLKDVSSKKIQILTRNSFFNSDDIVDLTDRIDYSKDFVITPTLNENKYLLMRYGQSSTFATNKYLVDYTIDYGQKRIDTNYNFNHNKKDMYEDGVFQNCTSILDTSANYRTFYNNNGTVIYPSWEVEGCEYTLYKDGVNTEETTSSSTVKLPNLTAVEWNSNVGGRDIFPKMCYFEGDGTEKELSDVSSSLVFFNGFVPTVNRGGGEVAFWLTDNLPEMFLLNDEACWLYTESTKNKNGETIAIKVSELPQFTRYDINKEQNAVISSWDFAVPKENYFGEVKYEDSSTIYSRFWERYFNDRYDVNTKKVECNVNLLGLDVTKENLRNIYYFSNCYWVLNKITNYDPCSTETTKCEFIKVNNVSNYTIGQNLWFLPKEAEQKQAEAVKVKFMDS